MNQEATNRRFHCAKYHYDSVSAPRKVHNHSHFSVHLVASATGGTVKFLANKPSSTSRVYLTKATYVTDDHRYLSLRPRGLLFNLPVSVRTTLAEQSAESDSESYGKGMNKS